VVAVYSIVLVACAAVRDRRALVPTSIAFQRALNLLVRSAMCSGA